MFIKAEVFSVYRVNNCQSHDTRVFWHNGCRAGPKLLLQRLLVLAVRRTAWPMRRVPLESILCSSERLFSVFYSPYSGVPLSEYTFPSRA